MRHFFLLVTVLLALPGFGPSAQETSGFPVAPPLRERVLLLDDHAAWTLRKADQNVVLSAVATEDGVVVSTAGGWLLLGPNLEYLPGSVDLLGTPNLPGTTLLQAAGNAVVFVSGSPSELVVLYPETAVTFRTPLGLEGIQQFAVTNQGFLFAQGRRASGKSQWDKEVREEQPLPFFPSDLTAGSDGTPWASDSLQTRPWRKVDDFWSPLEFPAVPSRVSSLAPFPDSSGYFAAGVGWVAAFEADGTPLWLREKDLSGRALPRDLRLRGAQGKLLAWSASERRVWLWSWALEGPSGPVIAPSVERVADDVAAEIRRLENLGSVPEALNLAQYGIDLATATLKVQPFSAFWKQAREQSAAARQQLKEKTIGTGVFTLSWDAPFGRPLATWNWEPDAAGTDLAVWRAEVQPFREGRPWDKEEFRLAVSAVRTPFPGATDYSENRWGLPSWLSIILRSAGDAPLVHWTRLPFPKPPQSYDLPVE